MKKFVLLISLWLFGIFKVPAQTQLTYSNGSCALLLEKHYVIDNKNFCRSTFYTWTTKKQVEELRKDPTLLTRSKSKTRGYSEFDIALKDTTFSKFPEAKILFDERFIKKRFAWAHSWATVMGWKDENYGNQLVKIVLKDDAIIGKFDETNKHKPFSFYTLHGDSLSSNFVEMHKDKIGAVYHIGIAKTSRSERKRFGTYGRGKLNKGETSVPFREYVIMNEAMINAWSYGTPDIGTKLDSEINMIKLMVIACETEGYNDKCYLVGGRAPDYFADAGISLPWDYYSSTCFQNDLYLLNKKRISAIEKKLEKAVKAQGPPISK